MEEQCQFVFEAAELWCVRWQVELSRRQAQAQEWPWMCCLAFAELAGASVWVRDGRLGCSSEALCAHVCGSILFQFVSLHTIDTVRFVKCLRVPLCEKCVL